MSINLTRDFIFLKEQAISDWESSKQNSQWTHLQTFDYWQKRQNEKYLNTVVDKLLYLLRPLTPDNFSSTAVQTQLETFFIKAIIDCPFLMAPEKKYLSDSTQLEASKAFLDQFLAEDGQLSIENLGQAMRNFWIANLLQACFGKPIQNTEALYGYSLLYPYSDNLMDSLTSDKSEKIAFCKRLTAQLHGNSQKSHSLEENRIFELVDKIYEQYPIADFPSVQMGLLAIHEAQLSSLDQQQANLMPYEIDLLGKCFQKGGTSLLADGLLVDPHMNLEFQQFCYGFGAILQLCDDLQDTKADFEAHHFTLFSQLKSHYSLDPLLMKMNGFLDHLMDQLRNLSPKSEFDLPLVISKNTRLLLLFAILDNERAFTRPFVKDVYKHLPIRPKSLKKLAKKMKNNSKQMKLFTSFLGKNSVLDQSIDELKNSLTSIS